MMMMRTSDGADSTQLKIISSEGDSKSTPSMPTPNTLARLEDPRAWHARGEVGIQRKRARNTTDVALELPMAPPLPKGQAVPSSKVVLEEEEYVERLGDIIEGDYFPHNAKMFRALTKLAHGGAASRPGSTTTPSGRSVFGTPSAGISTPGGSTPVPGNLGASGTVVPGNFTSRRDGTDAPGTGGALTRFVATHTSEDNQAFAELQEKDQEAFRKRYFWAYEPTNGEGNNAVPIKLLMMPDGKMMSSERRAIMDAACADRPKIGDHRPNQVETWKHRTRNQLMFSPNLAKSNDTCRIEGPPASSVTTSAASAPLVLTEGVSSRPRSKRRLTGGSSAATKQGQGKVLLLSSSSGGSDAFEEGRDKSQGEMKAGGVGQPGVSSIASAADFAGAVDAEDADSNLLTTDDEGDNGGEGELAEKRAGKGGNMRERSEDVETEGSEADIDSAATSVSGVDDAEPRQKGSPIEAPLGGSRRLASVVIKGNPKVIQAHATRFPMLPPPRPRAGKWASPIESPSSSRESVADLLATSAKDKDASDYAEVPMTPSRVPGVDGDSPQITWGSIDGTPMILDPRATPLPDGLDVTDMIGALGGSAGGPRFEIKDLPDREKLAHRLEADDTRRKRAKLGPAAGASTPTLTPSTPRTPGGAGNTPGTTGRPRSARGGKAATTAVTSLTPAARNLAAKLARKRSDTTPFGGGLTPGRQSRRGGSKKGGAHGGFATPTPSTPGSVIGRVGSGTPVARGATRDGSTRRRGGKKSSSLTDGLLAVK